MLRVAVIWVILSVSSFVSAESYIIENVTVLPMTGKASLQDRTVVIEDGHITAITKRLKSTPDNALTIDGTGKFLIPGLWDMHVHVTKCGPSALPLFLAHGVTSVRDMGGDYTENLVWRDEITEGKRIGPRILTCGPILESTQFVERMQQRNVAEPVERTRVGVESPEDAGENVQRLKDMGVDFLKVRTASNKQTHLAISAAADRAGLKLAGHASYPYDHMLETNQTSYEHFPLQLLNNKSEKERRMLFRRMAKKEVAVVPTLCNFTDSILVPLENVERIVENDKSADDANRQYVSPRLLEDWREQVVDRKESRKLEWKRMMDSSLRNYKEMHEEGVRILPGTDAAVVLIYPGFALHRELSVLSEYIDLSPEEALLGATRYAAEFMGVADKLGTVEKGKLADLVLLNANPLDDIQHTTQIHGVFSQSTYYDRAALDEMLANVAAAVK